jgi:D-arabinose 1-dehydrogenase-like Zn-dependent alcohol dehydrogenase
MHCYQVIEWGEPLQERDYPNPEPTGTQVLLKVDAAGICHSDIHIGDGYFDMGDGVHLRLADRNAKLPLTMGHEVVGEVIAVGPDAQGVQVGDKRVVYPWIGCDNCERCARGDSMLCDKPAFIGARVNGGYSDVVLVPHPRYLVEYGDVPTDLACLYACAGITGYSALKKLGSIGADQHILLIGAGGVGLTGLRVARAVHPAKVIVADIDPAKRKAAEENGADATIDNSAPDAVAKVMEMTGSGVAGSIDFVGMPPTSRFGIDCLDKGGTHVVVGLYGDKLQVPLPMFPFKQMTVRGSYVGTLTEMHELMDLVRAGKVPPIPVKTRPLGDVQAALDDLRAGKVVGRVVLKP